MKTVSVLGTCTSRDILNDERLKAKYKVNCYLFQVNAWDLASKGLDLPSEIINSVPVENFTRRMMDCDLNKTGFDMLKKAKSDYLLLDLYTVVKPTLKVEYKNKTVYMKNHRLDVIHSKLKDMKCGLKIEKIEKDDDALVYKGLDKLIAFLKKNYEESNIIINYPTFGKKYWDLQGKIVMFSQSEAEQFDRYYERIAMFSDYVFLKLPKAKRLMPKSFLTSPTSQYVEAEEISKKPTAVHLSSIDLMNCASRMLELLEGKKEEDVSYLMANKCQILENGVVKLRATIDKLSKGVFTSLNYYFKKLDLNKYTVLISVKNQAFTWLNKFYAKTKLGIDIDVQRGDSYIAVVDKKNGYCFEEASTDAVFHEYRGFKLMSSYDLNVSSILVDNVEYSKNRRGLNFVIVDNETNKVMDTFFWDSYVDEYLLISPNLKTGKEFLNN